VDVEAVPASVGGRAHEAVAVEIASRAITLLKDERGQVPLALPQKARVLLLSVVDSASGWREAAPGRVLIPELRKRLPGLTAVEVTDRTTASELDLLRAMAKGVDAIVAATFTRASDPNGKLGLSPGQQSLLEALARDDARRPLVTVASAVPAWEAGREAAGDPPHLRDRRRARGRPRCERSAARLRSAGACPSRCRLIPRGTASTVPRRCPAARSPKGSRSGLELTCQGGMRHFRPSLRARAVAGQPVDVEPVALDAVDQLADARELGGLHQVAVRVLRVGALHVVLGVGGREHHHRHRAQRGRRLDLAQHLELVDARQPQVEQDQARPWARSRVLVVAAAVQVVERFLAVARDGERHLRLPFGKRPADQLLVIGIVFDQEHLRRLGLGHGLFPWHLVAP
jgi:hypothetical protein